MQTVLTPTQGRAVLANGGGKGRNPFELVPYAEAISSLKECLTYDDTKQWNNFADAAEAWGKIHHSDEVVRLAKRVKLHAAKRCAELAIKLKSLSRGTSPGANAELKKIGMDSAQRHSALKMAREPKRAEALINSVKPPALGTAGQLMTNNPWRQYVGSSWTHAQGLVNLHDARTAARYAKHYRQGPDVLREQATAMRDWFDTFIAALPKKAR